MHTSRIWMSVSGICVSLIDIPGTFTQKNRCKAAISRTPGSEQTWTYMYNPRNGENEITQSPYQVLMTKYRAILAAILKDHRFLWINTLKFAIGPSYRKGKVAFLYDKSLNKVGQNSWRRTPLWNTADLIEVKRVCHHFHYLFCVITYPQWFQR